MTDSIGRWQNPARGQSHAKYTFCFFGVVAKYFHRVCPRCGDYLGVVIPELADVVQVQVAATCALCGYELSWSVVNNRESDAPTK